MPSLVPLWRKIQRENFTSLANLKKFLELTPQQCEALAERSAFPLNLPKRLAEKIEKGRIDDPLFLQFVPLKKELETTPAFTADAVGDLLAIRAPKYLQKYASRVLLLPTGACAMHCRYCFRQHYPYSPLQTGWEEEVNLVRQDLSLREVILSGGDPLSLNQKPLRALIEALDSIPHLQRIRFHTRFPIGIPERIDAEFLSLLASCSKQIWFVTHVNHPRELDQEVLHALKTIQKLGIPVLN
ncbi:MAG: KamA family radical SAM protein, partial [Chlamydiia bacterium]|nr:KamA family radical SAM protein [Chlamydiia bacterium]